jgi:hypothetical protein
MLICNWNKNRWDVVSLPLEQMGLEGQREGCLATLKLNKYYFMTQSEYNITNP